MKIIIIMMEVGSEVAERCDDDVDMILMMIIQLIGFHDDWFEKSIFSAVQCSAVQPTVRNNCANIHSRFD